MARSKSSMIGSRVRTASMLAYSLNSRRSFSARLRKFWNSALARRKRSCKLGFFGGQLIALGRDSCQRGKRIDVRLVVLYFGDCRPRDGGPVSYSQF